MSGAPGRHLAAGVALFAILARARLRQALTGPRSAARAGSAGLARLGGTLIGAGGAGFFAFIVYSLMATLAGNGEPALAAAAAGAVGNITLALAVLASALGAERAGNPNRPLDLVPLGAGERVLTDLVSVLLLELPALVAWPGPLAVIAGLATTDTGVAIAVAPAAAAHVVLAGAGALAVRRAIRTLHSTAGRLAAVLLPAGVLLLPLGPWPRLAHAASAVTPGRLLELAVGNALNGSTSHGLAAGLAALLVAAGAVLTLALHDQGVRDDAQRSPRRSERETPVPSGTLLALRHPRAAAQLAQAGAAALLAWALEIALASRGLSFAPLARGAFVLAAWAAAVAPSPLLGNALGIGGRAAGIAAATAPHLGRLLATRLLGLAVPGLALLGLIGVLIAARAGGIEALTAGSLGLSALMASLGTGAVASALWPVARPLDSLDAEIEPSGPARLLLPCAQTLALAPAVVPWLARAGPAGGGPLVVVSLALGLLIGLVGVAAGWRIAEARRVRIVEELIR